MKKAINYIIIFLFSFLMSKIVANNVNSIIINDFHIHHWIWGLVLLIIAIISKKDYLIAI